MPFRHLRKPANEMVRHSLGLRKAAGLVRQPSQQDSAATAKKVGIRKRIGWHTFRHTYSSLLAATGNDVKVVQELMRHAKVSTTMEVYTHAEMEKKRRARPSMCSSIAPLNRCWCSEQSLFPYCSRALCICSQILR
jgi:integrase